jgi:hypothetical protein
MGTVIQLREQSARGRHPEGSKFAGPGVPLPSMPALTPWWPVVFGLRFWSEVLAAQAAALNHSPVTDASRANVVPLAGFKARHVS